MGGPRVPVASTPTSSGGSSRGTWGKGRLSLTPQARVPTSTPVRLQVSRTCTQGPGVTGSRSTRSPRDVSASYSQVSKVSTLPER